MIVSREVQFFHGGLPLTRRDNDEVTEGSEVSVDDSLRGSIPSRYRDGLGGIDLEQVRKDQRQARLEVVRAMMQRLGQLRGRH